MRFLICVFLVLTPLLCLANPSYEKEETEIPRKPSNPPALVQKLPKAVPHCERFYTYQGKALECDSNLGRDGEAMRPLMKGVPDAIAELNLYQDNIKKARFAAYTGTLGLVAVIAGSLISRPLVEPGTWSLKPGGVVTLSGAFILLNSLLYGLSLNKTNEAHLSNAVNYHNVAHPERKIELQFSAEVSF